MTELLEFRSEQGGVVLVEVAEAPGGAVTRGGRSGAAVVQAGESLEHVLRQVGAAVSGIVSKLRAAADWPDELEVEFAVNVTADSNLIIARAGGAANFRIALRWSRKPGS
jgi:Trypsin-co-occurring domain 1